MKNFILNLLKFGLFSALMYTIILCAWGETMPQLFKKNLNYRIGATGHMFSRLQDISNFKDIDILFVGSSHAYRGFDPRMYTAVGLTSFNLGSSSQSPIQTRFLLEKFLNVLNPSIVVYEVFPATFCSDGVESTLDLIANDRIDARLIDLALSQNHVKVYNTLLYGFYRQFLGRDAGFVEHRVRKRDTYIEGGFVEKKMRHYSGTGVENLGTELVYSEVQQKAFQDIRDLLEQKGTPLVLVQAPVTQWYYQSLNNLEPFNEQMSNYENYRNYNGVLGLSDSLHFYDAHHMNQNGVVLFNQAVIADLRSDPLIRAKLQH